MKNKILHYLFIFIMVIVMIDVIITYDSNKTSNKHHPIWCGKSFVFISE